MVNVAPKKTFGVTAEALNALLHGREKHERSVVHCGVSVVWASGRNYAAPGSISFSFASPANAAAQRLVVEIFATTFVELQKGFGLHDLTDVFQAVVPCFVIWTLRWNQAGESCSVRLFKSFRVEGRAPQ